MKVLEGKLTLVTGSAKGIGEAIAKAFVEQGARVGVDQGLKRNGQLCSTWTNLDSRGGNLF